ncbi:telomere-associated protein Tap [Streptomyces sp. NBC_01353]|uniref:telomere-associated protein Tap n=1 Tax=Streptomyces sp. NBC_01353 TaxID=2903835 RepID=UPI002E31C188|nr:helix-turn-helix transcriptional regulator [Streptomyces sp. NBC_01353]
MSELFDAIDALLASRATLPSPEERRRLRKAHGLTVDEVAGALQVRRATVSGWESGKTEPRPPERDAYARLLDGLAKLYPADANSDTPAQDTVVPEEFTGAPDGAVAEARTPSAAPAPAPAPAPGPEAAAAPAPAPALGPEAAPVPVTTEQKTPPRPADTVAAPTAVPLPASATRSSSMSRRPSVQKATPKSPQGPKSPSAATRTGIVDPRFASGPLAVVDVDDAGQVLAYCVDGLVLDVPAKSLPALVEWTLAEAKLGAPRLHGAGKDADPLLVLTEAACERYGLPDRLTQEERSAGRLPEGHKVVNQLARADWQLTRRGLGPWARIYRPAHAGRRQCVQLCIPSWDALDARHWDGAAALPPAELARLLGTYATRVLTPRGSTAVTGLELMTALRPPTRAGAPDEAGKRHSEHNRGSLGKDALDCAPCEAPDGHPLLADLPRFHQRGAAEMLLEEAYDWARPLTDAECMRRHLVGIDVNMAFAAASNGAIVGLAQPPVHVADPQFDAKLPGAWLVDLSHVDLSRVKVGKQWHTLEADLLPSPFTPSGERPEGPAWYATPTVAYAVELGYDVAPTEAWVRPESGRFLDDWYKRLRDAYVATMADLGVTEDLNPAELLAAMDGYKQRDPEMAIVVSAIKATVKGGIGKLRERPRGGGWRPGQPWPALARPTWRPDIRAAVISRARVGMHRKIVALAAAAGRYPVAVLSDCAVYAADGPSPLDVLPYNAEGKTVPGSFRIGVSPGMVKHEGTQSVLWAEGIREEYGQELNLARYVKTGDIAAQDTGE